MSFGWKSIGHFLSSALSEAVKGERIAQTVLAKVNTPQNQSFIEAVTELIPGPWGVTGGALERGVFAMGGEIASLLKDGDAALEGKLVDLGLDKQVVADFVQLFKDAPGLFAQAKAAVAGSGASGQAAKPAAQVPAPNPPPKILNVG